MNNKDDENWLSALAGKLEPDASKSTTDQAGLLRKAMLKRREDLESGAMNYDIDQLKRLQDRMISEGLISSANSTSLNNNKFGFFKWLGGFLPTKNGEIAVFSIWSLAVNFGLAIVVVVQFGYSSVGSDDAIILRSQELTVLRVSKPSITINEIANELNNLNAKFVVEKISDNEYMLYVQSSEAVELYLYEKRINTPSVNGLMKIKITIS